MCGFVEYCWVLEVIARSNEWI